jgi:hypothetical protein
MLWISSGTTPWMKLKVGRRGGLGFGLASVVATGSLQTGLLILVKNHSKKLSVLSTSCPPVTTWRGVNTSQFFWRWLGYPGANAFVSSFDGHQSPVADFFNPDGKTILV